MPNFTLRLTALCLLPLLALPLAGESLQIPIIENPTFEVGRERFDQIEFLSEDVVQFHSKLGNSVWEISSRTALMTAPRSPRAKRPIDYDLNSGVALLLNNSGLLYSRHKNEVTEIQFGPTNRIYTDAQFSTNGNAVLAIGIDSETEQDVAEYLSVSDGSILWSYTREVSTSYVPMLKNQLLLKFDKQHDSELFESVSLIDAQTGVTLDTTNILEAGISALSDAYRDPQERLYLVSGTKNWTILINAAANSISIIKDGAFSKNPYIGGISISKDGTRFAMHKKAESSRGEPHDMRISTKIRDSVTGELIANVDDFYDDLPQYRYVYTFSPNGLYFYIQTSSRTIDKWNIASASKVGEYSYDDLPFTDIAISDDETTLFAAYVGTVDHDHLVAINLETGEPRYTQQIENGVIIPSRGGYGINYPPSIGFSPNRTYYFLESPGTATFYEAATNTETATLPINGARITNSAYLASRDSYLILYEHGLVEERNPNDFSLIESYFMPSLRSVSTTVIDPGNGHTFHIHDRNKFVNDPFTNEIKWGSSAVYTEPNVTSAKNGTRFIFHNSSVSPSGVWDADPYNLLLDFSTIGGNTKAETLSQDGSIYVRHKYKSGLTGATYLQAYSVDNSELLFESDLLYDANPIEISQDGSNIYTLARTPSTTDHTISLFEYSVEDGSLTRRIDFPDYRYTETITDASLSIDGSTLYALNDEAQIFAVNLADGSYTHLRTLGETVDQQYSLDTPRILTNADGSTFLYDDGTRRLSGGFLSNGKIIETNIQQTQKEGFTLTFKAQENANYFVLISKNMTDWENANIPVTTTNKTGEAFLATPPDTVQFIRIIDTEKE